MRLADVDMIYDEVEKQYKGATGIERNCNRNFLNLICHAPTIGAVPVVRCRECIYYKICDEWETGKRMLCEIHHHSYLDHDGDEHFCSWGQRREAEHDKHPSDPL